MGGAARTTPFVAVEPEGHVAGRRKRHSSDGGRGKKKKRAVSDSPTRGDVVAQDLAQRGTTSAKDVFYPYEPLTLVTNPLKSLPVAARMKEALRDSDPAAEN